MRCDRIVSILHFLGCFHSYECVTLPHQNRECYTMRQLLPSFTLGFIKPRIETNLIFIFSDCTIPFGRPSRKYEPTNYMFIFWTCISYATFSVETEKVKTRIT